MCQLNISVHIVYVSETFVWAFTHVLKGLNISEADVIESEIDVCALNFSEVNAAVHERCDDGDVIQGVWRLPHAAEVCERCGIPGAGAVAVPPRGPRSGQSAQILHSPPRRGHRTSAGAAPDPVAGAAPSRSARAVVAAEQVASVVLAEGAAHGVQSHGVHTGVGEAQAEAHDTERVPEIVESLVGVRGPVEPQEEHVLRKEAQRKHRHERQDHASHLN